MARAHFVQKARKDNPAVKAGESYWWWKFRYGGKHYSAKQPRPSQLTQSAYLSAVRQIMEFLDDWNGNLDALEVLRDETARMVQDQLDQCQESLENMPEHLQDGSVLQERVEACESAISEIENYYIDFEPSEDGLAPEARHEEEVEFTYEVVGEFNSLVADCEV